MDPTPDIKDITRQRTSNSLFCIRQKERPARNMQEGKGNWDLLLFFLLKYGESYIHSSQVYD
jgi:hypothetical protein